MSDISPIENSFSQVSVKVKKITEALYRVTDLMPDDEPLKWTLRKEAIMIFNSFLNADTRSPHELTREFKVASRIIKKILSLTELASFGSFIARTNFDVLSREYNFILAFVQDDLNIDKTGSAIFGELKTANEDALISSPYFNPRDDRKELNIEDNPGKGGGSNSSSAMRIEAHNDAGPLHFSYRHAKILSLVKEMGEVSIGDIYSHFSDISAKTIQRDLISLVNRGIIGMNGDKRWRRYALKNQ